MKRLALARSLGMIFAAGLTLSGQAAFVTPGYRAPATVAAAPGQLVTLFVTGLNIQLPAPQYAQTYPLPTTLAGISVTLQQTQPAQSYAVPIFAVLQVNACATGQPASSSCMITEVNVQIPFQLDYTRPAGLTVTVNGVAGVTFQLQPLQDNIHVLTTCDTILGNPTPPSQGCAPLVTHADGSLVTIITPARNGEIVTIYAVGLSGPSTLQSGTPSPSPPLGAGPLRITFDAGVNAGPSKPYCFSNCEIPPPVATFTGMTPGFVGLYQINVPIPPQIVPETGTPCTGGGLHDVVSNLTINLQGGASFDGAQICVEPGS